MPRKLIKKYSPAPEKIRQIKGLGMLSKWLGNPAIWCIHRKNVSLAFLIGLFWMTIPIPFQMIPAAIFAIFMRANLPLSVALVWISNPLTMAPIFYFNYVIGAFILSKKVQDGLHFELTFDWILNVLGDIWQPLFLGSMVVGLVLGLMGYFLVQLYWRWHVSQRWKKRQNFIQPK